MNRNITTAVLAVLMGVAGNAAAAEFNDLGGMTAAKFKAAAAEQVSRFPAAKGVESSEGVVHFIDWSQHMPDLVSGVFAIKGPAAKYLYEKMTDAKYRPGPSPDVSAYGFSLEMCEAYIGKHMTCLREPAREESYVEFKHDAQGNLVYDDESYQCHIYASDTRTMNFDDKAKAAAKGGSTKNAAPKAGKSDDKDPYAGRLFVTTWTQTDPLRGVLTITGPAAKTLYGTMTGAKYRPGPKPDVSAYGFSLEMCEANIGKHMTCLRAPAREDSYVEFQHDAQGNLVYNDESYQCFMYPKNLRNMTFAEDIGK